MILFNLTSCLRIILLVIILDGLEMVEKTNGHSFLLDPKGDFVSYRKPECRIGGPPHSPNDYCPGPCIAKPSWQYTNDPVTTTYARGQSVAMVWTRNNHGGGFIRFTLVPANKRMSHRAHARLAFHYTCYNSSRTACDYDQCGTDVKKTIYRATVQIPSIYPDGKYVLGWTWFGGIMFDSSYFGDYWSCSDVIIKGGHPVVTEYTPVFKSYTSPQGCLSTVDNVAICVREPCLGISPSFMVPAPFAHGEAPPPISAYWLKTTTPEESVEAPAPSEEEEYKEEEYKVDTTRKVFVRGVDLVDLSTNTIITSEFYRTIKIDKKITNMTFIAKTAGVTSHVTFFINGAFIHREKVPPYSCFGDIDGRYGFWEKPIFGFWINLNVSAVSPDNFKSYKVYWMRLLRE